MLTLQNPLVFAYAKMQVRHGIIKVPVSGRADDAVYGTTPGYATVLQMIRSRQRRKTLALDILAKL